MHHFLKSVKWRIGIGFWTEMWDDLVILAHVFSSITLAPILYLKCLFKATDPLLFSFFFFFSVFVATIACLSNEKQQIALQKQTSFRDCVGNRDVGCEAQWTDLFVSSSCLTPPWLTLFLILSPCRRCLLPAGHDRKYTERARWRPAMLLLVMCAAVELSDQSWEPRPRGQ